jgi:DNA polymerase alpha subunit B
MLWAECTYECWGFRKYVRLALTFGALFQDASIELQGPHLPSPYRTLCHPHEAAAAALEERIQCFEEAMAARGWHIDPVHTASSSDVHVVGRICADALGKAQLNAGSFVLEGSRATSFGVRVKLDLCLLTEYSLFPGQVVAMRGRNPTGACITAHELIDTLPSVDPEKQQDSGNRVERGARMVVAAGPFVRPDALAFDALAAVMQYCADHKPAALLLLGPFLPDTHSGLLKLHVTFLEAFERQVH